MAKFYIKEVSNQIIHSDYYVEAKNKKEAEKKYLNGEAEFEESRTKDVLYSEYEVDEYE